VNQHRKQELLLQSCSRFAARSERVGFAFSRPARRPPAFGLLRRGNPARRL